MPARLRILSSKIVEATLFFIILFMAPATTKPLPIDLFLRGYSNIPTSQNVQLKNEDIDLGSSWAYTAQMSADIIALRSQ